MTATCTGNKKTNKIAKENICNRLSIKYKITWEFSGQV